SACGPIRGARVGAARTPRGAQGRGCPLPASPIFDGRNENAPRGGASVSSMLDKSEPSPSPSRKREGGKVCSVLRRVGGDDLLERRAEALRDRAFLARADGRLVDAGDGDDFRGRAGQEDLVGGLHVLDLHPLLL